MAVKDGDIIEAEYTGRHEDGEVFDTSREEVAKEADVYDRQREYGPIEFEVGAGTVVEGFDEAVIGMEEGEEEEVTIPPEKAYGSEEKPEVVEFDRDEVKQSLGEEPTIGQHVHVGQRHGDIIEVDGDTVSIELTHPLAGETLLFEIEVVEIED